MQIEIKEIFVAIQNKNPMRDQKPVHFDLSFQCGYPINRMEKALNANFSFSELNEALKIILDSSSALLNSKQENPSLKRVADFKLKVVGDNILSINLRCDKIMEDYIQSIQSVVDANSPLKNLEKLRINPIERTWSQL